jgi:hypothetical protein
MFAMRKTPIVMALAVFVLLRSASGETSLTIYNKDFAVIRDIVKLDFRASRDCAARRHRALHRCGRSSHR